VLVVKLIAVLNARSGATPGKPCGLKGKMFCSRSIAYVSTPPTTLNSSNANA
jgi:hypothetical protein